MILNDLEEQINSTKQHVEKAIRHLEYSYQKIKSIPENFDLEDYELLESYEAFTSRFARLSDIVAKKFIRSLILKDDPSFHGGFMDNLNQAEKLGLISDARQWWTVRSLRNKEAHEYSEDDLRQYFKTIKEQTQFVLKEAKGLLQKL
jgi:hypothetical protein